MDTTVYLLGAGASAASELDLPVMKGFFSSLSSSAKYQKLSNYIKSHFRHIPIHDINIEELITHLEISMEKYK